MNLLQLQNGLKQYGNKTLFQDASFAVNAGEHIGVIGPNGAGKSTLFKILCEKEHLDAGTIVKAQSLRVGYLEQENQFEHTHSTAEEILKNTSKIPVWEIKKLGLELGLTESHFETDFQKLSGGFRMRMKLLYLIGQEPNLMLLDEPTNYLDLESILVLERYLQNYKYAFLLISHDREFLKRTTFHTLEIEDGELTKFPGNIDDYFEQKAQLRTILEAQALNQENKRKKIQDFVDRFGAKATKAKQAQSRLKQLDKLESIELKAAPVKSRIKIPAPIHTGKETLSLINADLGYSEASMIIKNCTLHLNRGTHLGVVGFNGQGKSTLLKTLAGKLSLINGTYQLGYQVSIAYYAQHVSDELNLNDTVIESLQSAAHQDVTQQEILNLAGSLLFSGDHMGKKISVLSGGEKARVALGQMLLKKCPLLILDEPTNHLDFDTVEALTVALIEYPGSVVIVSHDRSFTGRIAHHILEIHHGKAETFPGTYDEYLWSLEKGSLKNREEKSTAPVPSTQKTFASEATPEISSGKSSNLKQIQNELKELRKELKKQELALLEKNAHISELTLKLDTAKGLEISTLSEELHSQNIQLNSLEESIIELMEKIETLEKLRSEFL